jgi:FtsZ-interacting cell division protein ZipA
VTDLQVSLIILGVLAIIAVYIFNRVQENRYRRDTEKVFASTSRDALLDEDDAPPPPVEAPRPVRRASEVENTPESASAKTQFVEPTLGLEHQHRNDAFEFSPHIDYVVRVRGARAVSGRQVKDAVDRFRFAAKPVRWRGKIDGSQAWQEVSGPTQIFSEFQVGLQLTNRGGPASDVDIASFLGMVRNVGAEAGLEVEAPDEEEAQKRAQSLDQFCSAVDLLIGLNVVTADGTPLHGTKVRALAESEGMILGADGAFHFRGESGDAFFTLTNSEGRPFTADRIKNTTTAGVTFLFDVPRVRGGTRAFEKMVGVARNFAQALHGIVVDDNRKPLNDPEVKRISGQLDEIYARMEEHGIPGGSPVALRLFTE